VSPTESVGKSGKVLQIYDLPSGNAQTISVTIANNLFPNLANKTPNDKGLGDIKIGVRHVQTSKYSALQLSTF
jgi:hypothetical protein